MKLRRFFIAKAIGTIVVLVIVVAISLYLQFFRSDPTSDPEVKVPESITQTNACSTDADCGYARCARFTSSEQDLYTSCSYFATVKPRCVDNKCVYDSQDSIIDRCLPSCSSTGSSVIPSECYTPRDTQGSQNADAQCVERSESALSCSAPEQCKALFNGNCRGIVGTCTSA